MPFEYTFSCTLLAFRMPPITALLHTENDALRLGRALETLRVCDEIVVVDHGSRDATARVAREYGARILDFKTGTTPSLYLQAVQCDWIFCIDPRESLTEGLEATLLEWKSSTKAADVPAFSVFLREETAEGWRGVPLAQTRLVPRNCTRWQGLLPADVPSALTLEGALLRFAVP